MASSQVEIASSAPFCILRDHNRRDQFTNTFQKSLKDYLLQTCISNSSPDENSLNSGSWVRNPDNNNEVLSPNSKKHARVLERWAKARDMVASIDSPNREQRENSPTQSDTSVEIPNLGGVSSLVQRWRGFTETSLNQNRKSNNSHNAAALPPVFTSKSNSENVPPPNDTNQEGNTNLLGVLVQSNRSEAFDELVDERFDTPSMLTEDSFMDWESDRTVLSGSPSVQGGRDSTDGGESERVRVADVIRKLTSENQMQGCLVSWKNEQGSSVSSSFASPHPCEPSLPRLRTVVSDQIGEQRGCFSSPVVSSPRLRGRQAFNDLLMQLERDRHRELDRLVERRAVSKFSHRGRIQSLLRLRFLRREAEVRYDHHRQNLRREAPIGAQQQHSHSGVVEEAPQCSHCEVAVEAPRHSHATEFRPQQISCHGGDTNDETNLCHEGVGGCEEATVGPRQHLTSVATRFQQHSHSEATVGNQQHSFSKEVRDLETAQGEAAVADRQQSHSTSSEASRTRQPSAVVLLREKFDIRVENDASNPKTPRGVVVNNTEEMKNSSSSNQVMEEPQPHDENLESCSMEDVHKEASPSSDTLRQGIRDEVCNLDSKDYAAVPLTASNGWEEDASAEEQETSNPEQTTNEDMINCDWQEQESDDQQLVGTDQDWISVVSRPWSEWDEQEANSQQIIETNNDWITDISRPRSDWEGLREARYQEMLDPYLDNGDIRQLLERRSVSTFLSSNLRDTMDQLMISRAERLPQSIGNEQGEEDGFHGVRTWSHDGDREVRDDSDQVASQSSRQSQSSQASYPGTRLCSSFTNHSSITILNVQQEMELIYDLRGHMVQLQHEMSELRKSIKSCVNMQSKLQRSIKHEMLSIVELPMPDTQQIHNLNGEPRRVMKESLNEGPRKRCCVCYEMQVDSLLYRCGHMCTCFKCAHELQWSSGKCPICRAPIVDVVRAYANDS
ncbi:hypothetical protein C3L33_06550, partial [Rhododendron williamsianum]